MQRVRIGLTGLAFVFLAVLLAAIFTGRSADEEPITANLIEHRMRGEQPPPPAKAEEPPRDPLSELGVAPGGSIEGNGANPRGDPGAAKR